MRKIKKVEEGKSNVGVKNVRKGLEIIEKYDAYIYVDEQGYLCAESTLLGDDVRNKDVEWMYFWSWEYVPESDCWAIWIGDKR